MVKKYYYIATDKGTVIKGVKVEVDRTYVNKDLFSLQNRLENTINDNITVAAKHFLVEVIDSEENFENIKVVKEIDREEIENHIEDKTSLNAKLFLALYSANIEMLKDLSTDIKWQVRRNIASNLNAPVSLLELMVNDEDEAVRESLANNKNSTEKILEILYKDEDEYVRTAVASNPNTPDYILEELAQDEEWIVRLAVAKNLNTPSYILEKMVQDGHNYVREAVAQNPNTPVYIY